MADAVAERVAVMQDQAWFWAPDWQEGERDVDADIAAGRTARFGSSTDFTDHLDSLSAQRLTNTA